MDARPAISAEIERRVLVEAGHRCAIPTCRHIEVDIHHIVPWAQCQAHEYDNLIALCPNCHRRADRGEIDRKSLRIYKFRLRYAHDKFSQIEMDTLFELNAMPDGQGMPWLGFMLIFLKRLGDAGYIGYQRPMAGIIADGVEGSPGIVYITSQGREFVRSLSVE